MTAIGTLIGVICLGLYGIEKVFSLREILFHENRANIDPDIQSKLEYPINLENDEALKQTNNPEVIITNIGPIKAVAFSVDYKSYYYDKNRDAIEGPCELKKETHGHLIFVKDLQPSEDIKAELNGYKYADNSVGIYMFTLKYYRESDMKMYNRQDIYFVDNYNIISEKYYSTNISYSKIMQSIMSHELLSNSRVYFKAIDDHVWFAEETPQMGIIMLDDDRHGLTITGIPKDPPTLIKQHYSNANRPLLFIRPSQIEQTGAYLIP